MSEHSSPLPNAPLPNAPLAEQAVPGPGFPGAPHYGLYIKVWLVLLALTAVTIGASRMQMGKLNVWIALGIATTKASLVVLFFMHLKDEDRLFKFMFLCTCAIMAIFIGMTLLDVVWR